MKQVLTIFLEKDEKIESVRKKYVPNYEKFEPHITLVYPFEFEDQDKLKEHISESIKDFDSFDISLEGLQKSEKGFYVHLLVNKGNEKIVSLHEKLNGGMLNNFRNPDMPTYIAHLSIGVLDSEKQREKAIDDISKKNIKFNAKIKSIQLLTIDEDHSLKSKEDIYF
ncbi:MAG TPA: 2'-5' RNA ligase family protein [Candidatus Pacearchaeota archaeon]|jgi:2'-5' RNA ligase|nr:2'-5' RNA ligase family protein [Candidatus Pacearchaeota archaeon]|tara:strand:+ start:1246 stop:1746 length:501 start_codon:yes stop_codon:yes gene_type:complete